MQPNSEKEVGVLVVSGIILTFSKPCRPCESLLLPTFVEPALGKRFGSSFRESPETPSEGERDH